VRRVIGSYPATPQGIAVRKIGKTLTFALFALLTSAAARGEGYDFYINFDKCQSVVGYLVISNESLKIIPGEPTVLACKRQSSAILCDFIFKNNPQQEGIKGNSEKYKIVMDIPPLLHFKSETGAEYVAVDTTQHASTIITRIIDRQFAGAKVCQGLYATDFETKHLFDKK
jgi:hypothetical protein